MKDCSFFNLIKGKNIVVPDIQRDYVQGRDNIGTKVKIKNFIDKLVSFIVDNKIVDNKKLSLNFVYGYGDDEKFIPIDGQQRLTTLYLLHLFVFAKADALSEFNETKAFNYQVRPSSNRFFSALVKNITVLIEDKAFVNEKPIAQLNIKDENRKPKSFDDEKNDLSIFLNECVLVKQKWFRRSWLNDLTVKSSIIVLYLIKEAFKENNYENFADIKEKIKGDSITFSIRELEDPDNKANETYVKMNARGKQLTSFENFKVDLYEFFEANKTNGNDDEGLNENFINDFKANADSDWLTVLLELHKRRFNGLDDIERLKQVDLAVFELFNIVITNNYAKHNSNIVTDSYSIFNKSISKIHLDRDYLNSDEFSSKEAEKLFIKSIKDFSFLMNFLVKLDKYKYYKDENQHVGIYDDIIVFKEKIDDFVLDNTYGTKRLLVYSAILFLSKYADDKTSNKEQQFFIWMRIVKNIVEHSEIDNKEKFVNALMSLDNCGIEFNNVYESIKLSATRSILEDSPFNKSQILSERRKAELICRDNNWEEAILEYDNHYYFKGQSIFLTKENIYKIKIEDYKKYWKLTNEIFESYNKNKGKDYKDILTPWFSTKKLIELDSGGRNGCSFGYYDAEHHSYDWRGIFEKEDYVETYIKMLDEYDGSTNPKPNICEYACNKCEEFINSVNSTLCNKEMYLQYVLAHGYNITDWFVQGRYKDKENNGRYELSKVKSFNKDDCLDLALVYCLFRFGGDNVIEALHSKEIVLDCSNNCIEFVNRKIKIELASDNTYTVKKDGVIEDTGLTYEELIKKLEQNI